MKLSRINRLFNPKSGKCFDVAIDHGFFNEYTFLQGIENIESSVKTLIDANPDAIQLTVGQARNLQSVPGKTKPALVLRTDLANVYGPDLPEVLYSRMIEEPVLQAVRLDAACVVVNLFRIPGAPEVTDHCIQNILKLKVMCDYYSMPLMIEPLVFRPNSEAGGYMVDGNIKLIMPLVRQAVELGADLIKADPTDNVEEYHRVVEVAGSIPILVRGGGRAADEEILERTFGLMQQGAKGIVYGRNVVQHANPGGMTKALMAIVHDGATPDDVIGLVKK
ncbi:class I fructose-bisphosphate aldolase [Membranihabitans maritimus]|uniref:class I fructose-bisphosphate aldolase n=1 Tax=Membranihabitans maritimus TaxID=2904244 RepID=UPI001F178068|nr:hypothetical protein [Membranihabitans maritimus]